MWPVQCEMIWYGTARTEPVIPRSGYWRLRPFGPSNALNSRLFRYRRRLSRTRQHLLRSHLPLHMTRGGLKSIPLPAPLIDQEPLTRGEVFAEVDGGCCPVDGNALTVQVDRFCVHRCRKPSTSTRDRFDVDGGAIPARCVRVSSGRSDRRQFIGPDDAGLPGVRPGPGKRWRRSS